MSCRKVVCAECTTEWEGINYCADCLAKRRAKSQRGSHIPGLLALSIACSLLGYVVAHLLVWTGSLFAGAL